MSRVSVPIRARLWWEIFLLALRAEKIVRPKGDKKSKLPKPISLCISWDSLDLSSKASRRLISLVSVLVRARPWLVHLHFSLSWFG